MSKYIPQAWSIACVRELANVFVNRYQNGGLRHRPEEAKFQIALNIQGLLNIGREPHRHPSTLMSMAIGKKGNKSQN